MKKLIKAALFCAAAAGFIPYDLRKTEEGEVQSRSLFLEIRKKEQPNGETQVQVSFPMVERVEYFGKKLAQQLKDSCTGKDACQEEAAKCACDAECAAQAGDADAACACAEEAQACAEEASACPCGQQPEDPQPTEA